MSIATMVSLDNFILFTTPHSSCNNNDYIGSPRIRNFTSKFLLGDNKLYERYNGLWVLKSVLVDDKLITDYSFEATDILEEQILILSAFDKEVTIQFETLWEYFKLPSVAELNEISKQLTDRKLEGYYNPLKATYYTLLDDGKTVLSFEDWEIEMNTLHTKWLFCERSRLTDHGYSKDTIEDYLSNRTFKEFLKKFYDDGIQFYSKEVELPIAEVVVPPSQVDYLDYVNSVEEMRLSTGLPEELQIRQIDLPLSEYIDLMLRMSHSRLNDVGVIHHATVIHNHHHPVSQSRAEDLYNDSLQIIIEASGMNEAIILPEDGEELGTYIDSVNRLFDEDQDINYEDVTRHATNVYNYHRSRPPFMPEFEELTEVIDHPF